jgi:WD40 repeat protein
LSGTGGLLLLAAATLLAIGDASGIISSWDVPQSCLITAAQAHDGPVSCVGWSRSGGSSSSFCSGSGDSSSSSLVACGYDGAVSLLQADHSIAKLYSAAFRGLYYNCKKNNKVLSSN